MICENCGKEHDGSYKSGRFCSSHCQYAFSTKEKRKEINKKISLTLKRNPDYFCLDCGNKLFKKTISGYCRNCYVKHRVIAESTRLKISQANKGRSRWNIHRNQMSYAERFWKKVLENNKINFQREVSVKKEDGIHCYFLDFLIDNINLEIDGKQHLYENRKESDIKRDAYLQSLGYIVYRIPWNCINNKKGKELMKSKIEKFLSFLNDHAAGVPKWTNGADL